MTPIALFLSTNGDGTGTTDMAADYSLTPGMFYYQYNGPASQVAAIRRMIFRIVDTGSMDATGFGNTTALTNGLALQHLDSEDTEIANLIPTPIKNNSDFGAIAFDSDVKAWGQGDEVFLCRFTFSKFTHPNGVMLTTGEKFALTVSDDLSALNAFTATVEGSVISMGSP